MTRRKRRLASLVAALLIGCSARATQPGDDARSDGDLSCPAGWVRCYGDCVDLQVAPEHCGHCDCACTGYEDCNDGVCEPVGFGSAFPCSAPKKVCGGGELH